MGRHAKDHQCLYLIRIRHRDGTVKKEYIFENGRVQNLDRTRKCKSKRRIRKKVEPFYPKEIVTCDPPVPPAFPPPILPNTPPTSPNNLQIPVFPPGNTIYLTGERISDYFSVSS